MNRTISRMATRMAAFSLAAALMLPACKANTSPRVTIGTLLTEMVDRDAAALYPDPAYRSASFSSTDRRAVSKTQDWFANSDNNWFLGHETVGDREEYVMFDADGPGAITRWWMTFAGVSEGDGCIRIYIDGAAEPVLEGTPFDIVSGSGLSLEPIASSVSKLSPLEKRGHNLFYPIPYGRHCKITYSSSNLSPDADERHVISKEWIYYNIEHRTYAPGTAVESFSIENVGKYKALEQAAAAALANPEFTGDAVASSLDCTLDAGESFELKLKGPAAIREIAMQIQAFDVSQALGSTMLEIAFDGENTVRIPVGEFFGMGWKPLNNSSWYVSAPEDEPMTARWVMPFKRKAVLRIVNCGSRPVYITDSHASVSDWKFDRRSMYFHADWKFYPELDSRVDPATGEPSEHYDINFVTLEGKGVYMGDSMSLFDPVEAWWGEGDEKVYVDDLSFPAIFGTGTEDYYGYAWCLPAAIVGHPFTSQPSGEGNITPGYTFNSRMRSLDRICFGERLVFDMEMWHWVPSTMELGTSCYYYLTP